MKIFLREENNQGQRGIMINGSVHQEDTAVLNVYEPNKRAAKYMKQT